MKTEDAQLAEPWAAFFKAALSQVKAMPTTLETSGTLTKLTGLVLEATGVRAPLGAQYWIDNGEPSRVLAEVVGFTTGRLFLMPVSTVTGLVSGARVVPVPTVESTPVLGRVGKPLQSGVQRGLFRLPMGQGLLGRVLGPYGEPIDKLGPLQDVQARSLTRQPISAMDRAPVREPLDTGVAAINALLTVGRGQRLGLFAGSGVGKSILLGMMARYTSADVIVVGLIGERGREVKEFIEDILGEDGRARSVVIAAPADAPPLARMQGANYATAVAEYFRDQGQHVLLLMDSLTRYAMAQREIALAIGEPPATKGYPPSCFTKLPQLVERSGNGPAGSGSVTAFYTVLTEGDDQQDPIADAARAILDGHIVLSRKLAEAGHYPAIDIAQSASRVMHQVVTPAHLHAARKFRGTYARFEEVRELVQIGVYVQGTDPAMDEAIRLKDRMAGFLKQDMYTPSDLSLSLLHMQDAVEVSLAERVDRP
jgi:flagellum-specific ATP synthase